MAVVVALIVIMSIVVSIIAIVVASVFTADVMAVDPMMARCHVARDPNHFVVASPIARAMAVVWPVANLDLDAIRSNSGWNKNTRGNKGDEQKFVFYHDTTDVCPHRSGQYLRGCA